MHRPWQMHLPVDPRQIAVDAKGGIATAADESERTETSVSDVTIHEHCWCEGVQLHGLIVQLQFPEELKTRLPHPFRSDLRICRNGKRTLRIASIRHPLRAASPELGGGRPSFRHTNDRERRGNS